MMTTAERQTDREIEDVVFERSASIDALLRRVKTRADDRAAKALGSSRWDYVNELTKLQAALETLAAEPALHPVTCMDCKAEYGRSTVSGSTGICDPCDAAREAKDAATR